MINSNVNALEPADEVEVEDEDVGVAIAEWDSDFKPSSPYSEETYARPALLFQRGALSPSSETISAPSQFGVAVTPISVGLDGLKKSNLSSVPRFHINQPPLVPSPTMLLKQNPFLGGGISPPPPVKKPSQIPLADQLALGGHVHDREAASPSSHSLLYLGMRESKIVVTTIACQLIFVEWFPHYGRS